jgi:hypothetical protein
MKEAVKIFTKKAAGHAVAHSAAHTTFGAIVGTVTAAVPIYTIGYAFYVLYDSM